MHELQNGYNIFDFSAKVGGTDRVLKIYFSMAYYQACPFEFVLRKFALD